jgi:hypothetical protein
VKNYYLWRNRVPITGAVLLLISAHFLWSGVQPDQRVAKPRDLRCAKEGLEISIGLLDNSVTPRL